MNIHGITFDTTTIGNATKFLEWLQGHPLTRYRDGLYSLLGMIMIMEGTDRETARTRKGYLTRKVLVQIILTS